MVTNQPNKIIASSAPVMEKKSTYSGVSLANSDENKNCHLHFSSPPSIGPVEDILEIFFLLLVKYFWCSAVKYDTAAQMVQRKRYWDDKALHPPIRISRNWFLSSRVGTNTLGVTFSLLICSFWSGDLLGVVSVGGGAGGGWCCLTTISVSPVRVSSSSPPSLYSPQ